MYKWECPICVKQPEHFGIKEFAMIWRVQF